MIAVHEPRPRSAILAQPDAFALVRYLLAAYGRTTQIYVAAGKASPPAIAEGAIAIEADDLSSAARSPDIDWARSIVLCSLETATPASGAVPLASLAAVAALGAVIVLTTHQLVPSEAAFGDALRAAALQPVFVGRTLSDNFLRERSVTLAVTDQRLGALLAEPPVSTTPRPLAVIATYNDADIIAQLSRHHLASGLDLHFIDNWSADGTHEVVLDLMKAHPNRVTAERWPADGPVAEYRWTELLARKAQIAGEHPARWVIHIDSDEVWRSPWPDRSLAEAFAVAERYGANAVGASMFTFVPTQDGFGPGDEPLEFFRRFMYAPHDGYDMLLRAWRQPGAVVDLSSSGGHEAKFAGRSVFPYRFPLFHYPFRSEAHARRKIARDRLPRFLQSERDRGWHVHYAGLRPTDRFTSLPEFLHVFDPATFHSTYLLEMISDVVVRRRRGSLMA
jgi:hypothetical protein